MHKNPFGIRPEFLQFLTDIILNNSFQMWEATALKIKNT